jgi:DNA-binding HxlR family transcriptional regulator
VSRKIYLEVPPKVEYALTDEGVKLLPMLEKMNEIGLSMSVK